MSVSLPCGGLSIAKWRPWVITVIVVLVLGWGAAAKVISAYADAAAFLALLFMADQYSSKVQQPDASQTPAVSRK